MMKLQGKWIAAAMLLSSISLTSGAHAVGPTLTSADYGTAVAGDGADRTIDLDTVTKAVNVTNGETVRFTSAGKSFTWHFSTFNDAPFDLAAIAPKGIEVRNVRVYVAADPAFGGA